jgi:carboxypeptidase Q
MRRLFVSCFVLVAGTVAAEDAPPPRPVAGADVDRMLLGEIKDRAEVIPNLRHLCDEIGPRLTGSANLERANRWAADRMTAYGLTSVRLEPWEVPVGWERGTASLRLIEPGIRQLAVASAGWTPGTDGPVAGPVVVANIRTRADMAKYKGKLKGAVLLRGEPADVKPVTDLSYIGGPPKKDGEPKAATPPRKRPEPPKDGAAPKDGPPPPSMADLRAFRRELADFLKAEGVAAILADAAKPHGLLVTTGSWREGDRGTAQDPLPTLYVAHEHYALLHRLASRPSAPPTVEVAVTNRFVPGPITVFNTVGEVVGSEKPDEFVVIGAHLDSWDLASGATDNGTGSCVVLEAARAVAALAKAGVRPKRTIRFVLFTGEEQGLHGSKQYVKRHADEMARTSVALVHDTGTGRVWGLNLQGREAVRAILETELAALKTLEGWWGLDLRGSGGTDHLSFEAVGVPGFACGQDTDEYRLTHHTQSDTFDKAKEPNLIQGAQVMAVTAVRVANLPGLLPRDKPAAKK